MPATSQALIGRYRGTSIQTAFLNPLQLDLIQIADHGGDVIWKLDSNGTVTQNPTSQTQGTIIGKFLGSNFQNAFYNLDQLDVIQISTFGGGIVWYLNYEGTPIQNVFLSLIFEDDFTQDTPADPLNPIFWNTDDNDEPTLVGTLQTAADGPGGEIVAEQSPESVGSDWQFQYWVGDAPADVAVRATIANETILGGDAAIVFYRSAENMVGVDRTTGGCYQCSLVADTDGYIIIGVLKEAGTSGNTVRLFYTIFPGTISKGDTILAGVVGGSHFVFYNNIQVGKFFNDPSESPYIAGGPGSVGLGITNTSGDIPAVQFSRVEVFQARFTPTFRSECI